MWKCPKCGEEIEDRFDSCWKCAKAEPMQESVDDRQSARPRGGFWRAWRRGWLVLLMMLVYGLIAGLVTKLFERSQGIVAVAGIAAVILLLPACAYWIFVLFFGEQTWTTGDVLRRIPREDEAVALLDEATKLEVRGHVKEALAKYETVVQRFGGTAASRDAQKSIESLRAKIG